MGHRVLRAMGHQVLGAMGHRVLRAMGHRVLGAMGHRVLGAAKRSAILRRYGRPSRACALYPSVMAWVAGRWRWVTEGWVACRVMCY